MLKRAELWRHKGPFEQAGRRVWCLATIIPAITTHATRPRATNPPLICISPLGERQLPLSAWHSPLQTLKTTSKGHAPHKFALALILTVPNCSSFKEMITDAFCSIMLYLKPECALKCMDDAFQLALDALYLTDIINHAALIS